MGLLIARAKLTGLLALSLCLNGLVLSPLAAQTDAKFVIKAIAEKKLSLLPAGPLYWRVESYPTIAQAKAAEGPTSLTAETAGRVWLVTLGGKGGSIAGGTEVAEIGPISPPPSAPEYLLRINNAGGPPGVTTPVHTHPGSETFYVLSGELSQKTPGGVMRVAAGQSMPGHSPGMPMEVSSSGASDLNALVMFVVDAAKPFSSPAKFE
jgi:quercetin dioxygenase-like cupin family protein